VHERSELIQGLSVAAAPRLQQAGHIGDHCPGVYPVTADCGTAFSRPLEQGRSRIAPQAAEFRL
jgi:hypothetical protein